MNARRAPQGPEGTAEPNVLPVFYSQRVGPWVLTSLTHPEAPAKPIRSVRHD